MDSSQSNHYISPLFYLFFQIEECDKKTTTYDQEIEKKFGKIETYDDYDKKYDLVKDMTVFQYTKNFYLEKGEKLEKKTRYHEKITPAKQLGDEYLIKAEESVEKETSQQIISVHNMSLYN